MRLINADELKTAFPCDEIVRTEGVRAMIDHMPTVDAVPVRHGRWQWIPSTYDRVLCEKRYRCSKCHHETITHDSEPWEKFCPNCGARMDGKDGDGNG